jgi:hypothetical protein
VRRTLRTVRDRSNALSLELGGLRASVTRLGVCVAVRAPGRRAGCGSAHPLRAAGLQMQKAALEAEMRRLRRQEAAHFTTFSRVTAEKLEYMQKLSVAEGEAHMAKVMLRTVCFQPGMPPPGPGGGSRTRSDPSSSRLPVPFQAQSELAALQNASTGAWDVADRSPPVCSG